MRRKCSFPLVFHTILIVFVISMPSCDQISSRDKAYTPTFSADPTNKKILKWGVPTLGYYEIYTPLINYLNANLKNVRIQTIASNNFEDYLVRLNKREFDITIHSGLTALEQERNGYTIVGKEDNDDIYRGIILVNKDSAINRFPDLAGKTISSTGKDALAGHMMPMYFLHQNGVNVKTGIKILNLGSFESVILNVYHGNCSAGFCMLSIWESFIKKRPEIRSKVALKWKTPPMASLAVVFRNDIDTTVREELKKLLFSMHNTKEGKKILEPFSVRRFVPANTDTYYPMKEFLKKYNSIFQ